MPQNQLDLRPVDNEPLDLQPLDIQPVNQPTMNTPEIPQESSWWRWMIDPIEERKTEGGILDAVAALPDIGRNLLSQPGATLRGLGEGMWEGVKSFSPLDIASMATTGGTMAAGRAGLPLISRGLGLLDVGLSAPTVAAGATHFNENPLLGTAEMAGGALGLGLGARGLRNTARSIAPDVDAAPATRQLDVRPAESTSEVDDMIRQLGVQSDESMEIVDPFSGRVNNASGTAGGGSAEEILRQQGMQNRGDRFVVYDRTGQRRVIAGVDAQDYRVRQGETFGIEHSDGSFTKYDDLGGKVPENVYKNPLAEPGGNKTPPPPDGGPPIEPLDPESSMPIIRRINDKDHPQAGVIREVWNLARGLMPVDLPFITSAGLRQGLSQIGTKRWFEAWVPSIKSYGSRRFFEAHRELLKADPLMTRPVVPVMKENGTPLIRGGRVVFKETPSIAEQAGVKLTDLDNLTAREETIRSTWAEKIPVYGRLIAGNNRAYTAYINDLRLSTFRNFYEAMPDKNNMVALRQLGDAVNTFTGRGPLKIDIPSSTTMFGREVHIPQRTFRIGETNITLGGGKEKSLEKYASGLSEVLFAPKLIASRMQMLNPTNYIFTQPQVRREYLRSALRTAGAWMSFAALGKQLGADVVLDPTNSDFGKVKIGDFRLDPAGGFQQFLVLASRLGSNEYTSSTSGRTQEMGQGFTSQTRGSVAQNFIANKLHPSLKFLYDAMFANQNRQFGILDRTAQLAMPMITEDLMELAKTNPLLVPFLAPLVSAGMGAQFYTGDDFNEPKYVPRERDIVLGGE